MRFIISEKMKNIDLNLIYRRNISQSLMMVMLVLLQGCAPLSFWHYGPDNQTMEVFKQRVETAFRLENRLTSEVMLMQDNDDDKSDSQESIFAAEQVMQKNCSYLNEYASRDIDGQGAGFLLQHRVENSLLDCENAAQQLESLLQK